MHTSVLDVGSRVLPQAPMLDGHQCFGLKQYGRKMNCDSGAYTNGSLTETTKVLPAFLSLSLPM